MLWTIFILFMVWLLLATVYQEELFDVFDCMVQLKQVEKWDGKLPTYSGITNGLLNLK